jgi:hypothetical protein
MTSCRAIKYCLLVATALLGQVYFVNAQNVTDTKFYKKYESVLTTLPSGTPCDAAGSFEYFKRAPFKKAPEGTVLINPGKHILKSKSTGERYCDYYRNCLKTSYLPQSMDSLEMWLTPNEPASVKASNLYRPAHPHRIDTMGLLYRNELIMHPNRVMTTNEFYRTHVQNPINKAAGDSFATLRFDPTNRSAEGVDAPFYITTEPVTNKEYRMFISYVRDSTAHRILDAERYPNRRFHCDDLDTDAPVINWGERIYWYDDDEREALADMYLPHNERLYKKKEFDTRKYMCEFYWLDMERWLRSDRNHDFSKPHNPYVYSASSLLHIKEIVNIYPDTLIWLSNESSGEPYRKSCLAEAFANHYLWDERYDDYPVVGLNPYQIQAFLNYKSRLHSSWLSYKGSALQATYVLPTKLELDEYIKKDSLPIVVETPSVETQLEYWEITNDDYKQFLTWTIDSISHTILGAEVNEDHFYPCHECDASIDWTCKIWPYLDFSDLQALCTEDLFSWPTNSEGQKLSEEALTATDWQKQYTRAHVNANRVQYKHFVYDRSDAIAWDGHDLDLSYTNKNGRNTAIHSHLDVSKFIKPENLNVSPDTEKWSAAYGNYIEGFWNSATFKDSAMQGITYAQALAYYHWREYKHFPTLKKKKRAKIDAIAASHYPSKDQWLQMQAGEAALTEDDMKINLPSPTFRYVILVKTEKSNRVKTNSLGPSSNE